MMDGVGYQYVLMKEIPPAYVTVDVGLTDNGNTYEAMILAGVAICRITSSGDTSLSASGKNDTVSPGVSWWLFNKVSQEELNGAQKREVSDGTFMLHGTHTGVGRVRICSQTSNEVV